MSKNDLTPTIDEVFSGRCDVSEEFPESIEAVFGNNDEHGRGIDRRRDPLRPCCLEEACSAPDDDATGVDDELPVTPPGACILGTRAMQMVAEVPSDDSVSISHSAREKAALAFPKPGRGHRVKNEFPEAMSRQGSSSSGHAVAWVDGKIVTL